MEKKRNFFKSLLVIVLSLIFIYLTVCVIFNKQIYIDTIFYNLIVVNLRSLNLTNFFKVITYMGSSYMYIVLLVLGLIFIKNKDIPLLMIGNVVASALLMSFLKNIIKRPRPDYKLIAENGFSFPSGHSLNAVVFYGLLIYLIHSNVKSKKIRISLEIIFTLIILLIGLSRIYLGVHYASDVLAGFAFGFIWLYFFIKVVYKKVLSDEK